MDNLRAFVPVCITKKVLNFGKMTQIHFKSIIWHWYNKGYKVSKKRIFPPRFFSSCKVHIVQRGTNFLLLVERALKGTSKPRESPVVWLSKVIEKS